jgi:hypothetical protein
MLKAIAAALALSMLLVASCSSSESGDPKAFSCDTAKSKCANDPPFDPAICKMVVGHAECGKVFMAYLSCVGAHQTCLADGTTDQAVSARECAKEETAANDCSPADGGN